MPLKAKILNPAFSATISTAAGAPNIRKEPLGDYHDDVLFNAIYGARTIELNRPKKLNSLNTPMARKIIPRLLEWEKSQLANVIIMGGAGPKAFCAGGDVVTLAQQNSSQEGRAASHAYFGLEYQLNHLIATYPKPYIAYMDGITMGGGAGLSVHAPIRIATERTLFAMPETKIGFFPDVGASFFLPRLEGSIGTYLGLTGERLQGVNVFYAGIATHYIDSSILPSLTARLAELTFKDYEDMHTRLNTIAQTIAEYDTGLPPHEPMLLAGELRKAIDRCFHHSSVEAIVTALQAEEKDSTNRDIRKWATATLKTLTDRSPTSLKATLKQIDAGRRTNIAEAFQQEYALAGKFMSHPDFQSGVYAQLINKPATTPAWSPATLSEVPDADIDQMLKKQGQERLHLLRDASYTAYPYRMGLPREEDVEDFVKKGGMNEGRVLDHFFQKSGGRTGVREKVGEIVGRRCGVDWNGGLVWEG